MNFTHLHLWSIKKKSLDVIIDMPPNQEQVMPVHQEKKLWMMRMRTFPSAQSEISYEPRGDNLIAHEQETESNSEFTHPQMPLSQSMLDQSKMRQQRNQAHKAHNMAKRASQKEQKI
ncbi:hypothetical protein O181_047196 [Austropuccinia psidii MF-1]|uniref:Uncharacterized protein n=1 Tax=Austropuccinia psidii MF-1 TaxID=1389203 RepID=A0A9Q3DNC8_9BASI|nr:hypothetical protein [Austropuccinia psidii MF-1]